MRYDPRRVSLAGVLAPPYDVLSAAERAARASDPHSIVHLELPLDEDGEGSRYRVARRRLEKWLADGTLRRDAEPALYLYRQRFVHRGREIERRALFALVELAPPGAAHRIHPHENTLAGPRRDRLELLRATRAFLSPIFLLYRDAGGQVRQRLEAAARLEAAPPVETPWGTSESLAALDAETSAALAESLSDCDLVFADGHHRYESALHYHQEQGGDGEAAHGYALAALTEMGDPGLLCLPTHRVIAAAEFAPRPELPRLLEDCFEVIDLPAETTAEAAEKRLEEATASGRTVWIWRQAGPPSARLMALREERREALFDGLAVPVELRRLDVVALHAFLERGFGITPEDVRERGALSYTHDAGEAWAAPGAGAFLVAPTPVEDMVTLAEQGLRMPQKSTYFQPKLSSGWIVHVHDEPAAVWGEAAPRASQENR